MSLNDFIKVGSKIKEIRKSKGISQKYMAEEVLKIPRPTYSNYENDNRVPDGETLEKIAEALEVEIHDLLNYDNNIPLAKDKINLGENIKKYRELKGMTQTELANIINKSLRMMQKYEADDVTLTLDILIKIADYFNVSIDYLLGRGSKEDYMTTKELTEERDRLKNEIGRLRKAVDSINEILNTY